LLSHDFIRSLSALCCLAAILLSGSSCKNPSDTKSESIVVVTDSLQLRHTDSLYRRAKDLYSERQFEEARGLFDQVDTALLAQARYPTFLLSKINKSTNLRALQVPEEEALTVLKEALYDVRDIPAETFEIGSLYNAIAFSYIKTEEYSDSKYYALKALEVFNHPSNANEKQKREEVLQSYDRLAGAEQGLYNYEKTEEYYIKQLNFETSKPKETRTLAKIFAFYEYSGQYDKARILLDTVSWEARLEKTSFYEKYIFHISKLDFHMALKENEESLKTAKELDAFISNSPYGAHFTNWFLDQRLARIYLDMGNYDKVIEIVDNIKLAPGEEQLKNMGNSPHLFSQSKAYYKKGNTEKAKKVLQEAINSHFPNKLSSTNFFATINIESASIKTKLVGKLVFKAEMCSGFYTSSSDETYLNAALENYHLAHQLFKEIGANSEEDQFIENTSFKSFYEDYLSTFHLQWEISNKENLFYEALTVSDEAKNISVLKELKQINRNKLFRNIPELLRNEQQSFEKALDSISRVITIALDPKEGMRSRDSIAKEFGKFKLQLEKDHPKYYALLYGNQIPVKSVIADKYSDYNVIEYFVGENYIYIFNVNDGELQFDKIEFTSALKKSLEQLIGSLRDPTNSEYRKSSALVYESILAKYNTSNKKLALILDDELYALPFEVLTQMKDAMLLEQPTLRLNSITQSPQISDSTGTKALAFAPFASSGIEGRNKISNSLDEVEHVKNTFGGDIKLDMEATKEAFLKNASNFPIVHLATHSEVNKKVPLRSAIYFAAEEGGLPSEHSLELQELYNMNLNTHLVTLSSCETGLGKVVKGKGVQSISNAFSYAGVATTVMSLWKVPDKQTTQIMISFYEHLGNGEAKDEALHNAKRDYLKNTSDDNLRHPYYWAGFVISGDPSPIQISTPFNRYGAIGMLILGLVGLGAVYFRKKKRAA